MKKTRRPPEESRPISCVDREKEPSAHAYQVRDIAQIAAILLPKIQVRVSGAQEQLFQVNNESAFEMAVKEASYILSAATRCAKRQSLYQLFLSERQFLTITEISGILKRHRWPKLTSPQSVEALLAKIMRQLRNHDCYVKTTEGNASENFVAQVRLGLERLTDELCKLPDPDTNELPLREDEETLSEEGLRDLVSRLRQHHCQLKERHNASMSLIGWIQEKLLDHNLSLTAQDSTNHHAFPAINMPTERDLRWVSPDELIQIRGADENLDSQRKGEGRPEKKSQQSKAGDKRYWAERLFLLASRYCSEDVRNQMERTVDF